MRAELRRLEAQLLQERASTEREVARHDSALAEVNRDLDQLQTAHDRLRSYTQAGHAAALAEAEGQFETAKGAVQRNEAQMLGAPTLTPSPSPSHSHSPSPSPSPFTANPNPKPSLQPSPRAGPDARAARGHRQAAREQPVQG